MDIRSKNLNFIRWMNNGHKNTEKKLKRIIPNGCYLSNMALGKIKNISPVAREIEKELNLPTGWLDRDNILVITKLTDIELQIFEKLEEFNTEKKQKLYNFISSKKFHDI